MNDVHDVQQFDEDSDYMGECLIVCFFRLQVHP
jgi:hypothetical protein